MEINLFSKCIKDLIVANDRVDVPYLGTFTAELMPASYSDRQTTIHPPYRKMAFHKCEVSQEQGRLLLDKVVQETGVSLEQAGVELGWCLSRLCSELEGSKICKLPGLGVMRANARNEFYFVPDDDLDIWPDGIGLEPVSIKVSETAGPAAGSAVGSAVSVGEPFFGETADTAEPTAEPAPEVAPQSEKVAREPSVPTWVDSAPDSEERIRVFRVILAVVAVLLVLFIIASYLFTDAMSPILDRILYTREELRLLGK